MRSLILFLLKYAPLKTELNKWRCLPWQKDIDWKHQRIKQKQIDKYLVDGKNFIDEHEIYSALEQHRHPNPDFIRSLLKKSLRIENLSVQETAALIAVDDPELLRVEVLCESGVTTESRPAMQNEDRFALRVSELVVPDRVYAVDLQASGVEGRRYRKELTGPAVVLGDTSRGRQAAFRR